MCGQLIQRGSSIKSRDASTVERRENKGTTASEIRTLARINKGTTKMARLQLFKSHSHKFIPMLVAVAVTYGALLVAAEPANADSALFRARRTWWWSQAGGTGAKKVWPNEAAVLKNTTPARKTLTTFPSEHAVAIVGKSLFDDPATPNPSFVMPQSLIKDTTYFWSCPTSGPPAFDCYSGYLVAKYQYSYWNARAHFEKSHSQAAETTTTIRNRTIDDGGGWSASVPPTVYTPTVMYTLATPTQGGCSVEDPGIDHPQDCPGTTMYRGDYTTSRAGSIMITPGGRQFGGTLRWFGGPNAYAYQRISKRDPIWFRGTNEYFPISQQPTADEPKTIGYVTLTRQAHSFQLTNPGHQRVVLEGTTVGGIWGESDQYCSAPTLNGAPDIRIYPPISQQARSASGLPNSNHPTNGACGYYIKTAGYLRTGGPYTTGMIVVWDPNGAYSSKFTTTGYDNRTDKGLVGNISMVQPRLTHIYTRFPENSELGDHSELVWSSARPRKMVFTFIPEPMGIAMLAAGCVALAGLHRIRRR
jgi:hypothetical protein